MKFFFRATYGADLYFFCPQPDTSLHWQTTDTDGDSASRGVPVYVITFAGTHYAYPGRDGQAELTWVAGCIIIKMV